MILKGAMAWNITNTNTTKTSVDEDISTFSELLTQRLSAALLYFLKTFLSILHSLY